MSNSTIGNLRLIIRVILIPHCMLLGLILPFLVSSNIVNIFVISIICLLKDILLLFTKINFIKKIVNEIVSEKELYLKIIGVSVLFSLVVLFLASIPVSGELVSFIIYILVFAGICYLVRKIISIVIIIVIVFIFAAVAVPRFQNLTKPAVYLYPEKPTEVNITLDKSIKIGTNIPVYNHDSGWNVLAYPDGKIVDLQAELTDCNKIDSTKFGLEYAKKSCEDNSYPYIYWNGFQTQKPLPRKHQGWIVKKENIAYFLNNKLDYVGFNNSEKTEFLAYWTPKIFSLKQDEFFIYFLQTEDVNKDLPMTVTPQPDSVNRFYIFVDTDAKKHKNSTPQKLKKFKRTGFTLVDWGGSIK